jgi:hypothetical protein
MGLGISSSFETERRGRAYLFVPASEEEERTPASFGAGIEQAADKVEPWTGTLPPENPQATETELPSQPQYSTLRLQLGFDGTSSHTPLPEQPSFTG